MPIEICIEKYVGPIKSAFNAIAWRVNISGMSSRQGSTFLYVVRTKEVWLTTIRCTDRKDFFACVDFIVREPNCIRKAVICVVERLLWLDLVQMEVPFKIFILIPSSVYLSTKTFKLPIQTYSP